MDENQTPDKPESPQPKGKSWFTRMIGPALLSVTSMLTPVQAAPPATPTAKSAPAKAKQRVITFDISGPEIKVISDSAAKTAPKEPLRAARDAHPEPLPQKKPVTLARSIETVKPTEVKPVPGKRLFSFEEVSARAATAAKPSAKPSAFSAPTVAKMTPPPTPVGKPVTGKAAESVVAQNETPLSNLKGGKNVMVATSVRANNKQDSLIGGGSLTLNVSDHFYKAELNRKSKNTAGFNKNFYKGMSTLLEVIEGVEDGSYNDNNKYRTVGIGFNMSMPSKSDGSKSREIWAKIFGPSAPDFDACKNGSRSLSRDEINTLYIGMLKDSEQYLRKKFNQAVDERKEEYNAKHPGKKLLHYDALPANQRGALLSIHYQSPRIATRLYDKLAEGNVDKATNILLTQTLAKKYASRRDVEHGLMAATTTAVPGTQLAANVKAQVDKLKGDKKTVLHAYNTTSAQKTAVKTALAPKKQKANYVVSAHGEDGKTQTHTSRIAARKPDKGVTRTS